MVNALSRSTDCRPPCSLLDSCLIAEDSPSIVSVIRNVIYDEWGVGRQRAASPAQTHLSSCCLGPKCAEMPLPLCPLLHRGLRHTDRCNLTPSTDLLRNTPLPCAVVVVDRYPHGQRAPRRRWRPPPPCSCAAAAALHNTVWKIQLEGFRRIQLMQLHQVKQTDSLLAEHSCSACCLQTSSDRHNGVSCSKLDVSLA